jgi:hypothetical protein
MSEFIEPSLIEMEAEIERLESFPALQFARRVWLESSYRSIRNVRISLCTTCMGRLSDLATTLPKNILDNADYPELEFVVLDYNSSDNLGTWIGSEMRHEIESGRLIYARTNEPTVYSMTHSRNMAFRVATGEIVCNVDADNFTGVGFAEKINELAQWRASGVVFGKGPRKLRGRLGFWKTDFVNVLGGYDEDIEDYGFDDWDILLRAWASGFVLLPFGEDYHDQTDSPKYQVDNMKCKDWRYTEVRNRLLSLRNISAGRLKANVGRAWGQGLIVKNFRERMLLE